MIHYFRVLLIRIAKILPFIICCIVAISYFETLLSVSFDKYAVFCDSLVPYKPVSWYITKIIEYDWTTVIVLIILSVAVETCVWNKLSILYLCANLYEKQYFTDEMTVFAITIVCLANIVVSAFLVYKGIKMLKYE